MRRLVDRMILAGEQAPVAFGCKARMLARRQEDAVAHFCRGLARRTLADHGVASAFDGDPGAGFDDPGEYARLARRAVAVRARITEPV
jgi:hypothetical protein